MADDDYPLADEGEASTSPVVRRAHRRWKQCRDWESDARNYWIMDLKFDSGDSYNNYQWPTEIYQDRGAKPSLTVNETHQHNLHIINEAKQNKSSVKYRPTGDGATAEAAEVYEGLYRHIANVSNAQFAQGKAIEFQVKAGLGFTVIEADFVNPNPKPGPDAFNQEVYIRAVHNPLNVYLDCDCTELDGTGARYGFVFSDEPKDEVIEKYPELRGRLTINNAVDGNDAGWVREHNVRVAKYYEVSEDKDELLGDEDGTTVFRSAVPASLVKRWEAEARDAGNKLKRRPVIRKSVKWYLIVGNDVVDEDDCPGTCVPIIPWVGEVVVIDGRLDRKGHTRCMISAQQMENYNWSASVEYGALQSKSPWLAPVAAVGDYATYYQTANTENHSWMPYVHRDAEGKDIPPPERMQPPAAAPVYMEGVQLAKQFMLSASGQYEAELGEKGNEKSGKAINERQRQGDRATYHFIDNQALSIRRQGVIVEEWIRVIYDTKRTAKIIGLDDEETEIQIDPDAPNAHHVQQVGAAIQRIFNPRIGSYEVISDVGPDWGTQRQEAFNAIVQILTQAPELINKIGDLLFKVADFPLADEIADRLKPGMDPKAQEAITGLQTQLQKQNKLLGETMQALSEERLKVKAKDANADIDAYKADTDRLKALQPMLGSDPSGVRILVHQLVREALANPLNGVEAAAAPDLALSAQNQELPSDTGQLPSREPSVGLQSMPIGAQG